MAKTKRTNHSGKLRIGDDWNAITIIALSQNNPLKAVAEFVENSIDAGAKNVTITRGKERGDHYLRIVDDGRGVPRDDNGVPNFRYVATHVCDSIKRRLKAEGVQGIQGEFGIGLLSFWTVGEELSMSCAGADGKTYQMRMLKGDPNYSVARKRTLLPEHGTELNIRPLLTGLRQFSGEKIQWYLASELRERIRQSDVKIQILDRHSRKTLSVEPREFSGRLLHQLPTPACSRGEVYTELYLAEPDAKNAVGLYRSGTRILQDLTELDELHRPPWSDGFLQGLIDTPFLNLTPATRTGIIWDHAFAELCDALRPLESALINIIDEHKKAEEERTSQQTLRTIQKAFREALLALPAEEYDWFDIHAKHKPRSQQSDHEPGAAILDNGASGEDESHSVEDGGQKKFYEFAGPLFSVRISPASCVVPVNTSRTFQAIPRDRSRQLVEHDLGFLWRIIEGEGAVEDTSAEMLTFTAPAEPGLTRLEVIVTQKAIECRTEAIVTVTDTLLPDTKVASANKQGLPGYTYQHAPGELWRSKFNTDQNVIVINNGHRDFVYASRTKALKLRYISRLFAKELVYKNFPGMRADQLLERMIELTLYTEENLK